MPAIARQYLISGRVQAVGFRYFTESAAVSEGVRGWVRNLPDGQVEVCAGGEADAIERFERQIRQGPPGARVGTFTVSEATPSNLKRVTVR